MTRYSTGIEGLDSLLDGGLLPGTLTVVLGATGIGKTQLGIQFANRGIDQEKRRGVILDLAARGDGQSHREYAKRMCDWSLTTQPTSSPIDPRRFYSDWKTADYFRVFDYQGKRITRRDMEFDAWQDWQAQLTKKLTSTIGFLYGNFVHGARRTVIDGIEPVDRPADSIQFELVEYVYHQIIRKEHDWVARDLLRQSFRENAENVSRHGYETADISCLLLLTSREAMLDDLIARPLDEGDVLSNANTLIYMGRVRDDDRMKTALYVAKHRGSACDGRIAPYEITDSGLRLL